MSHVELHVEDGYLDTVLDILDNLKEGMIHDICVVDDSYRDSKAYQDDREYMQKRLRAIESGEMKLVPFCEGWEELDQFIDEVSLHAHS
ncbi:MAG: hypothetical protein JXQ76_12820 [Campylobacterales bacterium]|nr:hypothetical protein [Campylobacterales bacterium]